VKSSAHMEKECLIRCVKTLSNEGIQIQTLITDRHVQIVKWARENLPNSDNVW
jgi:solute carrier family 8 (sodium/calcium exchanger)